MTNEDIRKTAEELKDVAAGQIPRNVGNATPGAQNQDQNDPTPGDNLDVEQLGGAAAGQIARNVSNATPGAQSQDQNPPTPGDALDVQALGNAAAGAAATPQTSGSGEPDSIIDPPFNAPPQTPPGSQIDSIGGASTG